MDDGGEAFAAPGLGAPNAAPAVQAKLEVSQPNDAFEHEADQVADAVMRAPQGALVPRAQAASGGASNGGGAIGLQRDADAKAPGPASGHGRAGAGFSGGLSAARASGGKALSNDLRGMMEPRFGQDFGNVRVHDGAPASKLAQSIHAKAFTSGSDVFFKHGQFRPQEPEGQRLIAHELTHVLQQRGGSGGSAAPIQRQTDEEESPGEEGGAGESAGGEAGGETAEPAEAANPEEVPEFGPFPEEEKQSGCPAGQPTIGRSPPSPMCKTTGDREQLDDSDSLRVRICKGADAFAESDAQRKIIQFVRAQPTDSFFEVRGYASIDGDEQQNLNLSCHRANFVARHMITAGAEPDKIDVLARGETTKFNVVPFDSFRRDNLEANRAVTITAFPVISDELPEVPTGEGRERTVLDTAVSHITSGNYRIAADSYLSKWTCGAFPSLDEAVSRIEVLTESEFCAGAGNENCGGGIGREDLPSDIARLEARGDTSGPMRIVIPDQLLRGENAVECAINRIIDLTFHHMALPHLADRRKRHRGGTFLAGLAGFGPCLTDIGLEVAGTAPQDADPLADEEPLGCAAPELPTPLKPGVDAPKLDEEPVNFESTDWLPPTPATRPIAYSADTRANKARIQSPRGFISAVGFVNSPSPAKVLEGYEAGFLQTVLLDETRIEYVEGASGVEERPENQPDGGTPNTNFSVLIRRMPTPLLEGPASVAAPFAASPSGFTNGAAPLNLQMEPREIEFPLVSPFVRRPPELRNRPVDPLAEPVVGTVIRTVQYGLWPIARHKQAPLDRFSTHFLDRITVQYTEETDVTGIVGRGRAALTVEDAPDPSIDARARFTPPRAESLEVPTGDPGVGDSRTRVRERTERRAPGSRGLPLTAFRAEANRIAAPLREALGLVEQLDVVLKLDGVTGRILSPGTTGPEPTVRTTIANPRRFVPRDTLDEFSDRFFLIARRALVLGALDTRPRDRQFDRISTLSLTLSQLQGRAPREPRLHERPGVRDEMRQARLRTVAFRRRNFPFVREESVTFVVDRRDPLRVIALRRAGPPFDLTDPSMQARIVTPICLPDLPRLHFTVLGTVHTHPATENESGFDGPSGPDRDVFIDPSQDQSSEVSKRCGIEHYVITPESTFRATTGEPVRLGSTTDFLGISENDND